MTTTSTPFTPPPDRRPAGQQGLAIGLILASIALLAALSVTFLASSKFNAGWGHVPRAEAMAAALITEARNIRAGVEIMTARGTVINTITLDAAATTGLYNPQTGGTQEQLPPSSAMADSSKTWLFKSDSGGNPTLKLYNVGLNSNADYTVLLSSVAYPVCLMINKQLHNNMNIPKLTVPLATLITAATATDLSASTAGTQGWSDGCYEASDGNSITGPFTYIATIRAQ